MGFYDIGFICHIYISMFIASFLTLTDNFFQNDLPLGSGTPLFRVEVPLVLLSPGCLVFLTILNFFRIDDLDFFIHDLINQICEHYRHVCDLLVKLTWLKFLSDGIPRQFLQKFEPSLCRILEHFIYLLLHLKKSQPQISQNSTTRTSSLRYACCFNTCSPQLTADRQGQGQGVLMSVFYSLSSLLHVDHLSS